MSRQSALGYRLPPTRPWTAPRTGDAFIDGEILHEAEALANERIERWTPAPADVQSPEHNVVGWLIVSTHRERHDPSVRSQLHSERVDERLDEGGRVAAHRYSTPAVRELTTREMQQQRRLVLMSLAPEAHSWSATSQAQDLRFA
jgi:hypothetical protein